MFDHISNFKNWVWYFRNTLQQQTNEMNFSPVTVPKGLGAKNIIREPPGQGGNTGPGYKAKML